MEYAIIRTGGKQYKVTPGDIIEIDRLPQDKTEDVIFEDVLLHVLDNKIEIGKPRLKAKVKAKILEHKKGEKIRVSKFKAKSRYRKTIGFRAFLTKVQIEKITTASKK